MKNDNDVIWPGTLGKIKNKLSHYYNVFLDWICTSGLSVFCIVLIVAAVIIGIAALLGLTIGLIVGIPALILYLAFNAVVPVFGGPAIGYWTAVGIVVLLPIVIRLIHGGK